MKRTIAILGILTLILLSGCSKTSTITEEVESVATETVSEDVIDNWKTYETDEYTFQYPPEYQVKPKTEGVSRATIIYKDDIDESRIEIFKLKDFGGDRPFGFTGEETDDDIFLRETKSIGNLPEIEKVQVYLIYAESDTVTKNTFQKILKTIKAK
jgi:hypothetical protein